MYFNSFSIYNFILKTLSQHTRFHLELSNLSNSKCSFLLIKTHKVMEDLLNTQIKESVRLALPNGLMELMSDISREVLRAQPINLNKFIADYLLALLVTRENLSAAARICSDICSSACQPELKDALFEIGLSGEDVNKATEIIEKYFRKNQLKESNFLMKLVRKTNIEESLLPLVQDAVRKAYLKHQANCKIFYESSDTDGDEVQAAVDHTLKLYRDTRPTEDEYNQMATKIQAAYRAYGVRREIYSKYEVTLKSLSSATSPGSSKKGIRFEIHNDPQTEELFVAPDHKRLLGVQSSSSLVGSYLVNLPEPYSLQSPGTVSENDETEQMLIDYNKEEPIHHSRLSKANIDKPLKGKDQNNFDSIKKGIYKINSPYTEIETSKKQVNDELDDDNDRKKKISFSNLRLEIKDYVSCHEEEREECIEESLMEDEYLSDDGNEEMEIEEDIEENENNIIIDNTDLSESFSS